MHNSFGNALVVKAVNFLAANLILEQHGTVVFIGASTDHPEPGEHEVTNMRKPTYMSRTNCLYQKPSRHDL